MDDRLVLVTGYSGFLGTYVCDRLRTADYNILVCPADLRYPEQVAQFFRYSEQPGAVVHLAKPKSNGIQTMLDKPYSYMRDLLRIDVNLITTVASRWPGTRFIGMGSVCAYPMYTLPPTREVDLWQGYPERINAPYGVASRVQQELLNAALRQYEMQSLHFLTANLYGPGDESAHVIPSLILRMRQAQKRGDTAVTVWGDPGTTRSFLYVDDAARLIVQALHPMHFPGSGRHSEITTLNLAAPGSTTMLALAKAIADRLEWRGTFVFDDSRPRGHNHREFSTDRLSQLLGPQYYTSFAVGLASTIEWHQRQFPDDTL